MNTMQPTIQETDQSLKARSDEENINFRPSPNFKHMKKYLKSKFEEANQNALGGTQDMMSPQQTCTLTLLPKQTTNSYATSNVQPPLPPNPPPPMDTCRPIIIPKKEIIDDDEAGNSTEEFGEEAAVPTEETVSAEETEPGGEKKETMCRNFIRGTCKRGTSCIFAHKLILSQLPSVYTFCNNYQNSVCTFPKCKFVHATVFEKENFFRTGFLPPHTTSHLKDVFQRSPHPPETPVEVPVFSKPPPLLPPGIPPVTVVSNTAKTDTFSSSVSLDTSPLKRDWGDCRDFGSSPRDFEGSEPLAKKCKTCDSIEIRYQFSKNKLEKMLRTSDEMNKKYSQLNKKMMNLCHVISVLFKPMVSTKGVNGINNLTLNGEKDKPLLDPFSLLLATNNRFSMINDDKKDSFSNLIAKLLLNCGEPAKSPDTS